MGMKSGWERRPGDWVLDLLFETTAKHSVRGGILTSFNESQSCPAVQAERGALILGVTRRLDASGSLSLACLCPSHLYPSGTPWPLTGLASQKVIPDSFLSMILLHLPGPLPLSVFSILRAGPLCAVSDACHYLRHTHTTDLLTDCCWIRAILS